MLTNKYKYSLNHGLLSNLRTKKPSSPFTSYGLLAGTAPRQYEVQVSPQNQKSIIMFSQREYLHRCCSMICDTQKIDEIIEAVTSLYPKQNQTLTIFVANQPTQCEQILFGGKESLLGLAYRKLVAEKGDQSKIVFSAIGIQTENILTDGLGFQSQTARNLGSPLRSHHIKFSKDKTGTYLADNLTQIQIRSQQQLFQLIKIYSDCKNQSQIQKVGQDRCWEWIQGELFQLAEVQYDNDHSSNFRNVRNHYILRVNQYLRSSAGIMLKLGMNLRRLSGIAATFDNGESKLFKLLDNCFSKQTQFGIHIFLQIGHYPTIKEEYLNLVSTSQVKVHLPANKFADNFYQIPFLYLKHYLDNPSILKLIAKTKTNQFSITNPQIQLILRSNNQSKGQFYKSYAYETISSMQKRTVIKNHEVQQQNYQQVDIEKVAKLTAKLYRNSQNQKIKQDILLHKNAISIKKQSTTDRKSRTDHQNRKTTPKINQNVFKIYKSKNQPIGRDKLNSFDAKASNPSHASHSIKAKQIDNKFKSINGNQMINPIVPELPKYATTNEIIQKIAHNQILQINNQDQLILDDDIVSENN